MESTDIAEIENFLATAHPQDPKRRLLTSRSIQLKNEAWTKVEDWKPMAARPIIRDSFPPRTSPNTPSSIGLHLHAEEEEFYTLYNTSAEEYQTRTLRLLNSMFDKSENKTEAIVLIKNYSDCNIILRIKGEQHYNLPIRANGENIIVLNKGKYNLTSNVCDAKYISNKEITKDLQVSITNKNNLPVTPVTPSSQHTRKKLQKTTYKKNN